MAWTKSNATTTVCVHESYCYYSLQCLMFPSIEGSWFSVQSRRRPRVTERVTPRVTPFLDASVHFLPKKSTGHTGHTYFFIKNILYTIFL